MERVEPHLAGVVEVVDPEIGHDDAWPATQPATLTTDPFGLLRAAKIAGRGPEVDRLDEAAGALAHDHEDLAGVDRDLARATRAGQTGRRLLVGPDDRRVDVAEPIDLRGTEEPDVDEAALEVVAEQLEHADHGGRAGDDRRVTDAQRQARRPRPEDTGFVDELEVRRHRPLG